MVTHLGGVAHFRGDTWAVLNRCIALDLLQKDLPEVAWAFVFYGMLLHDPAG